MIALIPEKSVDTDILECILSKDIVTHVNRYIYMSWLCFTKKNTVKVIQGFLYNCSLLNPQQ